MDGLRREHIESLMSTGMDRDTAESIVDEGIRMNEKISEGKCPECDGRLSSKIDSSQQGPPYRKGFSWHNYKCLDCGYFFDRQEPNGS
jgi:rubredoxin